ncbi:uncharacterized protein LOC111284988 isoform X2 [Durio zibethinus]|uniref:Uncharacterized protein LOC111284988 isoform X2 n=1 Tax=Durio zibethinus TaxID=66656 RepID=A0A6P5XPR6_DURZI|nr:uncharacterized protein LOC111284988 isoform X2 [Durio zibethinus]
MLHKSFKPAKCKIALKLAIPRLKLMKNKREAQVKQLKRELAQLLESGQDQTARIRVEHVVREEKTVAAYNLLEIYCELIVSRMPMIESQKNCPIDLKEAISSVVFASARCEEIPELKDVSKHFTAKYGKEFTSAALEVRPNCGVGRMLVEKLSAKAPDGPTKLKILTAIAEEHNINWDPESFGAKESKIYEDLLNGPNTFTEATKFSADPPNIQASTSHERRPPSVQVPNYDKEPPNVQDPKDIGKSDAHTSFYEHSSRSSPHFKSFDYSNTGANNLMSSGTYPPNSYSGSVSAFSSPRQHWNMEFKDATAAAQAAAESAELASMAARAAAELSSRGNISQQYSMESHMSSPHGMRDEEPRKYTGSASQNEHLARHPVNNISFNGRNSTDYEQTDSNEQHNRAGVAGIARSGDKSSHGSFKSTAAAFNEKPSVNNQIADAYSQRNSSEGRMEHFAEKLENGRRNSGESRMHFEYELHDTKNSDFADYQEVRIRKQSSYSSSHSHTSTFTDDHDVLSNLNHQKSGNDSGEDSFLLNGKGSLQRSTKEKTDSYDNASAVFDDYGSDNDEDNFGLQEEYQIHENSMNFSSPGQISPTHPFTSTNSWRTEQNVDSPGKSISKSQIFSEQLSTPIFFESSTSSAVPSHGDDLPATFDNYGPSSESEEEVDKSKFVRSTNPSIGSHKQNMDSHQAENSIFTPRLAEGMEDTEHSNESSLEEIKELNFGNLTGGFRNKGYRHPSYSKIQQGNALSSGEAANDASTRIKQSSSPSAVEAPVSSVSFNQESYGRKGNEEVNRKLSTRASVTHIDSSDGDSDEERPKQTFSNTQEQYNKMQSFEENKRSSLRVPVPYFGSGNSDSDEDLPKTSLKPHSNASFSQRTRASLSNSRRSSNIKTTVSSSRSSDADEALPKTRPQKKNSDHWESFQHSRLASQPPSRLVSETKRSSFGGTLKSSEKEQPSTPVPKIISSGSAKSLKTQTSIGKGSFKETATHVHPKLPDYDTLVAHLNSLRQNRQ